MSKSTKEPQCPLGPCFTESSVCGFYGTEQCLNRQVSLPDGGSSLRDYIEFYRKLGFSVIPLNFREKTPALASWKQYQTRKPSDQEIAEWFSGQGPVNIGILCGAISGNLAVVDFDSGVTYRRFFKPEIEKQTLVIKTSKGFHIYLRSHRPVGCFKIPELKIDVKGEAGYVVAPPSIHPSGHEYSFVNPEVKSIMEVPDLEEAIWNGAEKLGVKRESFLADRDDLPCVKAILKGVEPGFRNEAGIRLAAYWLYHKHESREVTWDLLKAWNRRNKPPLPDTEIKSIMKSALRGGYEYGCKGFKEIKACDSEVEKNCPIKDALRIRKVEVVKTPFVELSDGRLAEQGYDGKKVYYLVYDPKTGKVTKEDSVVNGHGEIRFEPIMDDDVENGRVLFPSDAVEYGSDEELWLKVKNFIDYWHEEVNYKERQLDVAYVFDSYIVFGKKCLGLIPIIGIRRKLGYLGSGKTAAAQSVGAICYRGFYIAGCGTDAAIRNMFNKWRGTAIIDEGDFSRTDLYATIIKILNIGIDAVFGWHVKCDEEDPSKLIASYVFGPKILATRTRFKDAALESKMLRSQAKANVKPKPLYRWTKFNQQAQELRKQLIMWRFKHYYDFKAKVAEIEDPEIVKKVFGEDIDVSGRIKEVIVPLGIVSDEKTKKIIIQAALAHAKIVKSLDLETQFEERLQRALLELKEEMEAEPDEDLAKVAKLTELYEKGLLIFKFSEILEKMGLPSNAQDSERRSLTAKVGRVLADHEIETEQVRAGKAGRFQVVLIPVDHEFLTLSHKAETPKAPQPAQPSLETLTEPPPIPVPIPVPEDKQEDWKAAHPDFFVGSKQPLKKRHSTVDVCYTCWMAPKNKYQQMLTAGTIRWEPIKPTGEYMCQLCGKEPAGFRVIV